MLNFRHDASMTKTVLLPNLILANKLVYQYWKSPMKSKFYEDYFVHQLMTKEGGIDGIFAHPCQSNHNY